MLSGRAGGAGGGLSAARPRWVSSPGAARDSPLRPFPSSPGGCSRLKGAEGTGKPNSPIRVPSPSQALRKKFLYGITWSSCQVNKSRYWFSVPWRRAIVWESQPHSPLTACPLGSPLEGKCWWLSAFSSFRFPCSVKTGFGSC